MVLFGRNSSALRADPVGLCSETEKLTTDTNQYMKDFVRAQVQLADSQRTRDYTGPEDNKCPCVDISSWTCPNASEADKAAVVQQVLKYVTERGSFNISNHGVPEYVIHRLEASMRAFFRQPLEEKQKYVTAGDHKKGYVGVLEENASAMIGRKGVDLREIFSLVTPGDASCSLEAPAGCKEAIQDYYSYMQRLECIMYQILVAAMNFAKGLSLPLGYIDGPDNALQMLRCAYYPDIGSAPQQPYIQRMGPHADIVPLSILYAPNDGLEEVVDGKWTMVPPTTTEELHVNIGQLMVSHFVELLTTAGILLHCSSCHRPR
jgi:isopenicillin N synthase-like dioxygenase